MLHTICGSGMTLRLIRPICPFNCFLFRVDSLYHLHLNGKILQIIHSLTNHINGFDFISTLAVALSFLFFFLDYQAVTERHVCLALIAEEKYLRHLKNLKTPMHRGCAESTKHSFSALRTRWGTMVSLSRGGEFLLVYTCTQSWKFN